MEQKLTGLFIEDEQKNLVLMQARFALQKIELIGLEEFPKGLEHVYDYVIDKKIDFLLVDHELEKAFVSYKGIDVLKAIRKYDSNIYAVLLTNYPLETYKGEFGEYDFQLNKKELSDPDKFLELVTKIKRACMLRRDNNRLADMKQQQEQLDAVLEKLNRAINKEP